MRPLPWPLLGALVMMGAGPAAAASEAPADCSAPRRDVLDADYRRLLMAQVEGRALAIRQIYSAREVLRLERDWTPGLSVGEAIKEIRFDPDGRLAFTWLKGPARDRVSERVTVPSFAR